MKVIFYNPHTRALTVTVCDTVWVELVATGIKPEYDHYAVNGLRRRTSTEIDLLLNVSKEQAEAAVRELFADGAIA